MRRLAAVLLVFFDGRRHRRRERERREKQLRDERGDVSHASSVPKLGVVDDDATAKRRRRFFGKTPPLPSTPTPPTTERCFRRTAASDGNRDAFSSERTRRDSSSSAIAFAFFFLLVGAGDGDGDDFAEKENEEESESSKRGERKEADENPLFREGSRRVYANGIVVDVDDGRDAE